VFQGLNVQKGALRPHPCYEHTRRPQRDSDYSTTPSDAFVRGMGHYIYSVFNQLDAQNLFYNKFYFMPLHVSGIITPIGVMIPEVV